MEWSILEIKVLKSYKELSSTVADIVEYQIQEYAKALKEIMLEVFPETTKIWSEVYWK